MTPKNIVILGSTGSIGINALNVVSRFPDRFRVFGLSCYNSVSLLAKQIECFRPRMVALPKAGMDSLRSMGSAVFDIELLDVEKDVEAMVAHPQVDVVIIGIRGSAALLPFLSAVRAGKTVAPANKEALVIAGDHIMSCAKDHGAVIIPVDSEQSAIFQCLQGVQHHKIRKVLLTASGGPLRNVPRHQFEALSKEDILRHPRWKMGPKITVDSATLLNKGFEVIEAMKLFNLSADQIEVIVHPEAVIHSMVEFVDGSVMAQMGVADMRLPIQYALTYPERLDTGLPALDLTQFQALCFEKPDLGKFSLLRLAMDVAREGGTLPAVLNAANEAAVDAFLDNRINLNHVCNIVEHAVASHRSVKNPSINEILEADQWARDEAMVHLERVV